MEYKKDEKGEFILDEQGNKIPEDVNGDKETEISKLVDKKVKPLVEEVKTLRQERDLAKKLLEENQRLLDEKNKPIPTEEDKVVEVVEKVLQAKESSNAQVNKKTAFEKYCTEHSEFNPDNDSLGLKRDALLKKFNVFNTESLKTIDEFYSVVGDAHKLLGGNDINLNISKDTKNPYSDTPIPKNNNTKEVTELSPKEKKLCETSGWTKEKFLKLKEKDPSYVNQLLEYVHI